MTTAFVVSRVEAELVKAIFDKDGQNVPHMTGAVLHVPTNSVQLFVKAIIDFQNDSSEQEYLAASQRLMNRLADRFGKAILAEKEPIREATEEVADPLDTDDVQVHIEPVASEETPETETTSRAKKKKV